MHGSLPHAKPIAQSSSCLTFRQLIRLVSAICFLLPTGFLKASANFQGLGDLPGAAFNSQATAVSADGLVVIGFSESASGTEAFRWTLPGGIVGLGDLPAGDFLSEARDVSADGSVIVGVGASASGREAFRWVQGVGMTGLGDLAGGAFNSEANGVSADGSVVVGTGRVEDNAEGFRWTIGGGMVGIGYKDFPNVPEEYQDNYSRANGVSADGSVIVGSCNPYPAAYNGNACHWTESTGMISLGGLPNDAHRPYSLANAVSSDGFVVVGSATSDTGGPPGDGSFRWTEDGGTVGLGFILDRTWGATHRAAAVSADGSSVVGVVGFSDGDQAYLWTDDQGIRLLRDILTIDLGLDLNGWTLTEATGISDDGLTIVGTGINPNGDTEAFIVILPEPATISLFVLSVFVLQHRRASRYSRRSV